ncbi:hypothetical protein [Marilutibacter chinensis]|uniref:Transmembrane protein n=1 Tax=Marilutibacter chinensis TaxID=2912247 RepID=A0ABS9HUN1_9GAMM|nr:hypothetical protein [Lysobacter chinensis]MCF7221885.1 hypothetical protein [Lysobacter chinensis]
MPASVRQSPPEQTTPSRLQQQLRGGLLILLSVVALVMLWVLLNLYTGHLHSWMAVVAALDLAWMLRFGGWRRGGARALVGLAATALVVVVAQWFIIATQIGAQIGLTPLESALKLGIHHAWTLARLANGPWELGCIVVAALVAVLASR